MFARTLECDVDPLRSGHMFWSQLEERVLIALKHICHQARTG